MTNEELKQLASYIVEAASTNETFLHNLARAMRDVQHEGKRLISTKEAAALLGISVWSLYRIKNYPDGSPIFSCVKTGTKQSSTLRYDANTIQQEYAAYLASKS